MKRCSKCGQTKALTEFHAQQTSKDGRGSHCRTCSKRRLQVVNLRGKKVPQGTRKIKVIVPVPYDHNKDWVANMELYMKETHGING